MRIDWRFMKGVLLVMPVVTLALYITISGRFAINVTDSLGGVLYSLDREYQSIDRGSVYAFQPPQNRFYEKMPFLKIVKGVPGDEVAVASGIITVNGVPLGEVYSLLADGRKIESIKAR